MLEYICMQIAIILTAPFKTTLEFRAYIYNIFIHNSCTRLINVTITTITTTRGTVAKLTLYHTISTSS